MKDIKVKICGIQTLDSALDSIEAGADFLGFNFVNSSHRFINPLKAKEIIDRVKKHATVVGVFRNEDSHQVNELTKFLGLHVVQLHGSEGAEYIKKIKNAKVMKVFNLPPVLNIEQAIAYIESHKAHHILLDRSTQGTGEKVSLSHALDLSKVFSTFLAGGLTPENVSEVVSIAMPFGVDVAGGVEVNGVTNVHKIKDFINNAKEKR